MNTVFYHSPLGTICLEFSEQALVRLDFVEGANVSFDSKASNANADLLCQCTSQLDAYFAGKLRHFDLPIAPRGTTFQREVWAVLQTIPFGEKWSYLEVARQLNNPKAVRAVGAANGLNPIAIIIPCHRVIGSNGTLTGYAGGLWRKQRLLEIEECPSKNSLF